jgi:hypothetical protein
MISKEGYERKTKDSLLSFGLFDAAFLLIHMCKNRKIERIEY